MESLSLFLHLSGCLCVSLCWEFFVWIVHFVFWRQVWTSDTKNSAVFQTLALAWMQQAAPALYLLSTCFAWHSVWENVQACRRHMFSDPEFCVQSSVLLIMQPSPVWWARVFCTKFRPADITCLTRQDFVQNRVQACLYCSNHMFNKLRKKAHVCWYRRNHMFNKAGFCTEPSPSLLILQTSHV